MTRVGHSIPFPRLWQIALILGLLLGGCKEGTTALGEYGNVLFNSHGTYDGADSLVSNPFLRNSPVIIDLDHPSQDTLLTSLSLHSEPSDHAQITKMTGGRYLVTAKYSGPFSLYVLLPDGELEDSLSVESEALDTLDISEYCIDTVSSSDDSVSLSFECFQGDSSMVTLYSNQSVTYYMRGWGTSGRIGLGMLDLDVTLDETAFDVDIPFPAVASTTVNRVLIRPEGTNTGLHDIFIGHPSSGITLPLAIDLMGEPLSRPEE